MILPTSTALSPKLSRAFSTDQDALQAIRSFDLTKVNIYQRDLQDFLKLVIAPSISDLTKEDVRTWPDELKIIASAITRLVEGIPIQSRSWEHVVAAMMQNSGLKPEGSGIHRMDNLSVKDDNLLRRSADKTNEQIAREVEDWFMKLVGDEEVLRTTPINYNDLAAVFRAMQQGPKGLPRFVRDNTQHHEKTLLDISVLCYPNITRPYVKLYRVKLTVWSFVDRVAGIIVNKIGMTGAYYCRTFLPRQEIISRLSPRVRTLAAQEAEDLFL